MTILSPTRGALQRYLRRCRFSCRDKPYDHVLQSSRFHSTTPRTAQSATVSRAPLLFLYPRTVNFAGASALRRYATWSEEGGEQYGEIPGPRGFGNHGTESSTSPSRARQAVLSALQSGDSLKLVCALAKARRSSLFYKNLPPATVAQIWRTLDFEKLVEPYRSAHGGQRLYELAMVSQHIEIFRQMLCDCAHLVMAMMKHWRSTQGSRFSPRDYTSLLAVASEISDVELAEAAFKALQADGVVADVKMWNYYLEVLSQHHHELEEPEEPSWAKLKHREGCFTWDHGTAEQREEANERILASFDRMTQEGIAPDTDTYCHVMRSMRRVRHIGGAKRKLEEVWGLNVDVIFDNLKGNEAHSVRGDYLAAWADDIPSGGSDYDTAWGHDLTWGSFIYPNDKMLATIVQIFGRITDLFPHILSFVEEFSRRFGLSIGIETWTELLRCAFYKDELAEASVWEANLRLDARGHAPLLELDRVWATMQSPQYAFKPNLTMYRIMMNSLYVRGQPIRFYEMLVRVRELVEEQKPDFRDQILRPSARSLDYRQARALEGKQRAAEGRERLFMGELQRADIELSNFYEKRFQVTIRVLQLLDWRKWDPSGELIPIPYWTYEFIPTLLHDFCYYQDPGGPTYEVNTGQISFDGPFNVTKSHVYMTLHRDGPDGNYYVQGTTDEKRHAAGLPTTVHDTATLRASAAVGSNGSEDDGQTIERAQMPEIGVDRTPGWRKRSGLYL